MAGASCLADGFQRTSCEWALRWRKRIRSVSVSACPSKRARTLDQSERSASPGLGSPGARTCATRRRMCSPDRLSPSSSTPPASTAERDNRADHQSESHRLTKVLPASSVGVPSIEEGLVRSPGPLSPPEDALAASRMAPTTSLTAARCGRSGSAKWYGPPCSPPSRAIAPSWATCSSRRQVRTCPSEGSNAGPVRAQR